MYTIIVENVKTGDLATLIVFSALPVGSVIGWGTDDGESIAQWKVTFCKVAGF